MILAIDMGNSNIKIGVLEDEEHMIEERVSTAYNKTSMEYAMDITAILEFHGIDKKHIDGAILSSVVPPLTGTLRTAVRKVRGKAPLLVRSNLHMHIGLSSMKYPEKVGADLLAGLEGTYFPKYAVKIEPDEAERMGENARKIAETANGQAIFEQWKDYIETLTGER